MTSPVPPPALEVDGSFRPKSDLGFFAGLAILSGVYIVLIVLMLMADATYTTPGTLWAALDSPEIRYAIALSLLSCTFTTVLSLWLSVPIGYVMSRFEFRGKALLDAVLDIPIVLPPLVIGLSLLILFRFAPFRWVSNWVVYEIPSVVLAQLMVACAFAVRTMRTTFDQIPPRQEQVAMTLGCSRGQAFWYVTLPQAETGMLAAATLAWARSLGEFGPILIFSGSTRLRTEVLPTTVFLEMQAGNLRAALAVSMIMVIAALVALVVARVFGRRKSILAGGPI
ncbi:MAG: molybdenum ABC transporter permease [Planctomycetes bacterium RBG_16_64_10]|nr:MAG: molybdenum ABC transporter permease [Planctomycetes bacterium RBG_16_64_10]